MGFLVFLIFFGLGSQCLMQSISISYKILHLFFLSKNPGQGLAVNMVFSLQDFMYRDKPVSVFLHEILAGPGFIPACSNIFDVNPSASILITKRHVQHLS